MPTLAEKKRICIDLIETAHKKAAAHYGVPVKMPKVRFSNRMISSAGHAKFEGNRLTGTTQCVEIALSIPYMTDCWEEFVNNTPIHEAAHSIAVQVFGWQHGKGHGRGWKSIMWFLGQSPERCHSMTLTTNKRRKRARHLYIVDGHEVIIGDIRHKRIQGGKRYVFTSKHGIQYRIKPEHHQGLV